MTKLEMRTRVKGIADAVNNARWTPTYIDDTISRVHTSGWRRILNANNTYRSQSITVTTASDGAVAFSALSTGTTDSVKRFYRVLGIRVGNLVYGEEPARDWILGGGAGEGPWTGYYFANQSLYLPQARSTSVTIWVNHLPVAFNAISADSVAVTWPTDYEDVLCYDAAAELLMMGAMETGPAAELKAMANAWWLDMLGDISRLSVNPLQFTGGDMPDFG